MDQPARRQGLNLLCSPGNDVESTTALAGSGANLILFTTGLGTPTGNPVTEENMREWIEQGGVFITSGSTAAFPIDMGIARRISIRETRTLQARGSIVRTVVADSLSPITYGYKGDIPTYFSAGPVFSSGDAWALMISGFICLGTGVPAWLSMRFPSWS